MKRTAQEIKTTEKVWSPRKGDIGRVTLVGAGPGDAELITLKAVKALQGADVVLYDALVDPVLLEHAERAEHIFVGKRRGCYNYQQQQINDLIVQRALAGNNVVRLKGGDPFVFGRGAEEMEYAAAHGLEVNMVPGITSAIAVPALLDIPVTKRGLAESFWVITGTTRDHALSEDVAMAARTSATVVILMGMSKLAAIVDIFRNEGKSELPVAVIQNGTTADEKTAVGTVASILKDVEEKQLTNPAIIIIGEVVRHRQHILDLQSSHKVQQASGEIITVSQPALFKV